MVRRLLFAPLALLLSSNVASADPESAWIVNGDTELGFDSAVALGVQYGDTNLSVCSGNLITPSIILSAGHCGGDDFRMLSIAAAAAFSSA